MAAKAKAGSRKSTSKLFNRIATLNVLKTVNAVNDGLTPVLLNGKLAFLSDASNSRISFLVTPIKDESTKAQVDVFETLACFKEDVFVRLNHLKTAIIENEMI